MCLHNTKSNSTNFKTSLQSITSAVTAMQGIKAGAYIGSNGLFDTATVNAYRASIKGLSATQAEAALSASGLTAAQRQQILTSKESTVANAGQATSFNVLTKAVWANVKAMAKWLVTTPTGWITLAIGATAGLIAAYNNVEKKQNELIENARNLQEEYRSFAKDTAGKITSLEGQAEEFNKLAKGVDKYGNNISLASDEYDRYKSIVAEILGYSPELIQGYDAEGNAIADKNGLLERSIELLKEEQRLKLKEMTTDEKTGEAYDAAEAGWQQVQGYEGANTRNEIARWFDNNALRGGVNYEVDIAKVLGIKDEWKEEGNNLQNAIINNIDTVVKNIKDKKAELLAISDSDGNAIFSVDEIDNMIDLSNDWQYAYNQWQQDIEDAKHGMDDQFDLYAQRAKSYSDLTDAQKVFVNEYIRATGDITDAEGHLLSEDKILEKAKGYEKFVNEFAELNKLGEGGSVDLTFRPEIDTEELNKKGWEAGEGFATVFSSAISNTDFEDLMPTSTEDTVAINFTPIIVDPNTGEFKGVLSEEELYAYAHDVLAGVREDDLNLQIGAKFEGKNAIDEAVADGERIHYLHEKLFINNDTVDSWEELRKVLVKTGDDAVQAGEKVNKMTVSLSELEKTSDNIKTLASAFKELSDDGYITTKTLGEIKTATGLAGDEWEEYETRLLSAKKGSSEFNQAMSDLTYKILESSIGTDKLANSSESYVASVLRENGVLNANEVAHSAVERAKFASKVKTLDLEKAIKEGSLTALKDEALQCGYTETAFINLIAQEQIFNNTSLDASQQIQELQKLERQAWGAAYAQESALGALSGGSDIGAKLNDSIAMGITADDNFDIWYNGENYGTGKNAYENARKDAVADKWHESIKSRDESVVWKGATPTYANKDSSSGASKNEALDNYLKDAENRYKIHQNETKYIEDLNHALNNLVKTEDERLDVTGKINEAYRGLADNRIKDLEHQIDLKKELYGEDYDATSEWTEIQRVAKEEANRLRAMGYDNNSNEIQALQKTWWDAENSKLDFYSKQHENLIRGIEHARDMALEANPFADTTPYYKQMQDAYHKEAERLRALDPEKYAEDIQALSMAWHDAQNSIADWSYTNSQNWITLRNTYNDWDKYGDNEAKAWKRVLDRFKKEFPDELDKIREIEENYYNAIKDEVNEILDLNKSRIESQKTLLQSYYGVSNSVAEAQHEINKELKASQTMYEYLDESTRKLLFNQEDYNILSDKLVDIQGEAEKLQRKYNQDILSATADNLDEITSKYEMQYEALMKSYEIAKAELEVAKKRQQLDNVLNERNVRMFIDGQWQWVANTQDVIDAQNEYADAKFEAEQALVHKEQTESMNELTSATDKFTTIMNKIDSGAIDLRDGIGDITSSLKKVSDESVPALENVLDETKAALRNFASSLGNSKSSSSNDSYASSDSNNSSSKPKANATATIPGLGTVGVHIDSSGKTTTSGLPSGTVIHTGGGDYKITGGSGGKYTSVKVKNKYASGTGNTKTGDTLIGEVEPEIYIDKNGHLIPVLQPTIFKDIEAGGKVFNGIQMKNLESLWNLSNIGFNHSLPAMVERNQSVNNVDNSIHINGMTISEQGNEDWIDGLKRYVYTHKGSM